MQIATLALMIPLLGTMLGAAFVFFLKKNLSEYTQKTLMGFASGVMVAASVWSLLNPAIEMREGAAITPVVVGLLIGFLFLLIIDDITPHLHKSGEEGPHTKLSRTTKLTLAVTIHNLPEGMAVGIAIAEMLNESAVMTPTAVIALSVGIAIQNIPEGAIISTPLLSAGNSRLKSFVIGCLSGVVEPIGGVLIILLASHMIPLMPLLLSFAAGAMLYVVVEELIPEASQGKHSNLSTIGFAIGFTMMMTLDVVLG